MRIRPIFKNATSRAAAGHRWCAGPRPFVRVNGCTVSLEDGGLALAHQLELVAERADSLAAGTDRFEVWLRARVT
jgi:hypothetical protein